MRVSFPPCGKGFGGDDFCEPRLRLTSAAVQDSDNGPSKQRKSTPAPLPAGSSFVVALRPTMPSSTCCSLPPLASREACRSAGTYPCSARWALSNDDDVKLRRYCRANRLLSAFPFGIGEAADRG